MPNTSQKSWYDNPNAPNIPSQIYFDEKANFAGMLTCAVSYGAKTRGSIYPPLPPCLIYYSRICRHLILPMHERIAQSR